MTTLLFLFVYPRLRLFLLLQYIPLVSFNEHDGLQSVVGCYHKTV